MFKNVLGGIQKKLGVNEATGAYGRKKKKSTLLPDQDAPAATLLSGSPNRAQELPTDTKLESAQSMTDEKRKRRQRPQRGANPMTRGASVVG